MQTKLFVLAQLSAILSAYLFGHTPDQTRESVDPEWPARFQGQPLRPLPLSTTERRFVAEFPGKIARFTDDRREVVFRHVHRPTRQLHPATDCYRGLGYTVSTDHIAVDRYETTWRCFTAQKAGHRKEICERIYDTQGQAWTDTSAWFWSAALGRSNGPWWAVTVASDL